MGGAYGPANFPVSFSIELVCFDEDGACGFGSGEDDDVCRDSFFCVYLQHISYLYILRFDLVLVA